MEAKGKMTKKTPILAEKPTKKRGKARKKRPSKNPDQRVRHAVWSLAELLKKKNLDGRLSIVKKRNRLEAQWIDHSGGPENLTVHMISLIKRIATNELIIGHGEDEALMGEFDITSNNFLALENTHRRNMESLDKLIAKKLRRARSLEDYIESKEEK